MSLIHNRHSASVNAAITLSEIEYQESECSTEKTAIDDKASITKQDVYELESYNDQKGFPIEGTESILSKKKRKWLIIRRVSYIIIMNAALPIALYYVLKPYLPIVWALVLSSTPTIISVIVQAIFLRKIDSIGVAVIFGFILSVVLAVLNGDPKLLLLRESFVTAGVGLICAITLIPMRYKTFVLKPVLYYLASDLIPMEPVKFIDESRPRQKRMGFYWEHSAYCRFHFRLLTAIDVVILELEFGLKLFYVLSFDIDTVVVLSNSTLSAIGVIVSLSTIAYMLKIRKRLKKDEPEMLKEAGAL